MRLKNVRCRNRISRRNSYRFQDTRGYATRETSRYLKSEIQNSSDSWMRTNAASEGKSKSQPGCPIAARHLVYHSEIHFSRDASFATVRASFRNSIQNISIREIRTNIFPRASVGQRQSGRIPVLRCTNVAIRSTLNNAIIVRAKWIFGSRPLQSNPCYISPFHRAILRTFTYLEILLFSKRGKKIFGIFFKFFDLNRFCEYSVLSML